MSGKEHLRAIAGKACVVDVQGTEVDLVRPKAGDCVFVAEYMDWAKEAAKEVKDAASAEMMEKMERPKLCVEQCLVACIPDFTMEEARDVFTSIGYDHPLAKRCALLCGADRVLSPIVDPLSAQELLAATEGFDDHPTT